MSCEKYDIISKSSPPSGGGSEKDTLLCYISAQNVQIFYLGRHTNANEVQDLRAI